MRTLAHLFASLLGRASVRFDEADPHTRGSALQLVDYAATLREWTPLAEQGMLTPNLVWV